MNQKITSKEVEKKCFHYRGNIIFVACVNVFHTLKKKHGKNVAFLPTEFIVHRLCISKLAMSMNMYCEFNASTKNTHTSCSVEWLGLAVMG